MELPQWFVMAMFGLAAVFAGKAAKGQIKWPAYLFALLCWTGALKDAMADEVFVILIALLIIAWMVIMIIRHQRKQRKKQRENERLDELINHFNWHRN